MPTTGSIVTDTIGIVSVIVLVLANGFFVASEFSLVAVRRSRVIQLAASGGGSAAPKLGDCRQNRLDRDAGLQLDSS